MYYFVEIACVIAELFIADLFFGNLFNRKNNKKLLSILCYSSFAIIIICLSFIESASILRLVFSIIGFAIIVLLLYQTGVFSAVFASISFMIIYALIDIAVMVILNLFSMNSQEFTQYGNVRTLFIVITHIILFGIIVCLSVLSRNKEGRIQLGALAISIPSWIASLTLCCTLVVQAYETKTDFRPIYLVVSIGLLYTNILMIYFVNRIREQDRLKHEADLNEHHYAIEKEYYEQFYAQKEQIRALWHDISKYMRAIQTLVKGSDSQEAEKSLAEAQALVDEIHEVVDVNNRAVSVILNEYMNLARNEKINLSLDVSIPSELFVSTADLYVMLGNTIDNAIEACSELEENDRYINLLLKMHNNLLHYRIENPYVKEHLLKKRIGIHGYGLGNVERCAQKYGGFMQKSSEGQVFVVNVTLNKS